MKKILILLCFVHLFCMSFGQEIHTISQIFKMLTDSRKTYEYGLLEKSIPCKDYSEVLNFPNYYRLETDSGFRTVEYEPNELSKEYFLKAEDCFVRKEFDSAFIYYQQSLFEDSSFFKNMTYIGQIYRLKGDYENAIKWYRHSISHNYIDYMAHWFLADIYFETGQLSQAIEEIVIAQILNRNNPRIKKSVDRIFEKKGIKIRDWYFNPQIEITQLSEDNVKVMSDKNWTGFAFAKALWDYEPGYKQSMGVAEGVFSSIEGRECLYSLYMGLKNSKVKIKKIVEFKKMEEAIEKGFVNEFIFYEMVLPEKPFVVYQLEKDFILRIKDYVIGIRNVK